jgi:hypothetical protein
VTQSADRRDAAIARMEETGSISSDCKTCQEWFYSAPDPLNVMAPRHKPRCGARYAHCTCDRCF